jgi:hypothetical protein
MELSAQTAQSPPRFLVTYWPLAIVPGAQDALWKPTSGAAGGYALQPFADNGLAGDMITLRGVSSQNIRLNGGGGREGGLVALMTATDCGGTRTNRGEPDDAYAAGPSVDQILLKSVSALRPAAAGVGFANAICDQRTDLGEVSTKCLSYAHETQPVTQYSGETGTENIPQPGVLSPLGQYTTLFSSLIPGAPLIGPRAAAAAPVSDAMLAQLASKRSVLDFALSELSQLKATVPSEARSKLQTHYEAVLGLESDLAATINSRYPTVTGTGGAGGGVGGAGPGGVGGGAGRGGAGGGGAFCKMTPAPPSSLQGTPDWTTGGHGNYGSPTNGATDDIATHQMVGKLHLDVLRAAFLCDIIRCGTFQWAPATSHVGFKGMFPGDDVRSYQHCAVSNAVGNGTPTEGSTPDTLTTPQIRFLFNVEAWYFARHAENLKLWKDTVDAFGNSLLDYTIIPFVTETADLNDARSNMPEMIFGGKKLGMLGGQYKTGNFSVNSFWGTIAQAFGLDPTMVKPFAEPIPGLWSKPAAPG